MSLVAVYVAVCVAGEPKMTAVVALETGAVPACQLPATDQLPPAALFQVDWAGACGATARSMSSVAPWAARPGPSSRERIIGTYSVSVQCPGIHATRRWSRLLV